VVNPGIVRSLIDRYVSTSAAESGASSHWRALHEDVRYELDADGQLVSLEGSGFGSTAFQSAADRFCDSAAIALHLAHLPHRRRILAACERLQAINRRAGGDLTLDQFRQACSYELIDRYLPANVRPAPRVVIIGDGHGTLAALIAESWPAVTIALVDLGRTLVFQAQRLQQAHPARTHALAGEAGADRADVVYCAADRLDALDGRRFDVAINIASMQEMGSGVVAGYFSWLRQSMTPGHLFYCCNREHKTLVGGEVSEFAAYPWRQADRIHLDARCPWHQYFVSRGGGVPLRLAGVPVPLMRHYDGPHRHRLVTLELE
jgi:hypothetical protein